MILHTCEPTSSFFNSHRWRKKLISHTCKTASEFFDSHKKIKEMILHTCESTGGFFYSHRWKKMMLHICALINKFFNPHKKRKWNDIPHLWTQLQLCKNNYYATLMQLVYNYHDNVMLTLFFIDPSKSNLWYHEDFWMIFFEILNPPFIMIVHFIWS